MVDLYTQNKVEQDKKFKWKVGKKNQFSSYAVVDMVSRKMTQKGNNDITRFGDTAFTVFIHSAACHDM